MRCTVQFRLLLPSQWTRKESDPASTNSSRKKSGSVIIMCISSCKSVTRLTDWTIAAPIEMLGTKCPSIISTGIRSAPARSASTTCSPKLAKSSERIEGASLTLPLSISRVPLGDNSRNVSVGLSRHPIPVRFNDRALLGVGRVEDTLNGFLQHRVELSNGLLGRQPFQQRPRKARHHAVISAQPVVGTL